MLPAENTVNSVKNGCTRSQMSRPIQPTGKTTTISLYHRTVYIYILDLLWPQHWNIVRHNLFGIRLTCILWFFSLERAREASCRLFIQMNAQPRGGMRSIETISPYSPKVSDSSSWWTSCKENKQICTIYMFHVSYHPTNTLTLVWGTQWKFKCYQHLPRENSSK